MVESDSRVGNFIPGLLTHGEVEVRDKEREEFDEEFPEEMFAEQEEQEHGNAIKNEEILDAAHEQAGKILEQAKKDAEKLVEQAKITAELEKEKILEESKKAGYKDGLVQANDEVASQKEELEQRAQQLEPDFVKLVINLVKKLTGVLVENKKDIILYLMEQSLKNLGKTMKLVIRVSADDVEMVRNEQERLLEFVDKDCEMEIVLDSTLKKNQCLLEADKQIIDCSLDVQMQSLIENLKMMM